MAAVIESGDDLLGQKPLSEYNADERRYSVHIRETLLKLIKGDIDVLDLMAKYYKEPGRIGAVPIPPSVDPTAIRISKVEEMLASSIRFLHDGTEGGPMAQEEDLKRGAIIQKRDFPTRFPHIVIERTDIYDKGSGELIQSSWCVHRVQNQRNSIRVNRVLDILSLGMGILQLRR